MDKQDKMFHVVLIAWLVVSAIIVTASQFVGNRVAYTHLENPATYRG